MGKKALVVKPGIPIISCWRLGVEGNFFLFLVRSARNGMHKSQHDL